MRDSASIQTLAPLDSYCIPLISLALLVDCYRSCMTRFRLSCVVRVRETLARCEEAESLPNPRSGPAGDVARTRGAINAPWKTSTRSERLHWPAQVSSHRPHFCLPSFLSLSLANCWCDRSPSFPRCFSKLYEWRQLPRARSDAVVPPNSLSGTRSISLVSCATQLVRGGSEGVGGISKALRLAARLGRAIECGLSETTGGSADEETEGRRTAS